MAQGRALGRDSLGGRDSWLFAQLTVASGCLLKWVSEGTRPAALEESTDGAGFALLRKD